MLINKRKNAGIKHFNDSKALNEYSNNKDDIHNNIEEHNPNQYCKMLTVFDDMIADTLNKKLNPTVTEIFTRSRKLNFLVFITKSYFAIPKNIRPNSTHYFILKNIRLNSTHYFILKISNKLELQQILFNHSTRLTLKTL